MGIFNRMQERKTGTVRPESSTVNVKAMTEKTAADPIPNGFAISEEYLIKLVIGASFWANPVQYKEARKQAERCIAHELYGDILWNIDKALQLVNLDDREELQRTLLDIRSILLRG